MEVIIAILLCVVGFLVYLLFKSRDEVARLKIEISRLQTISDISSSTVQTQTPPTNEKTFVRVIFNENDRRYYDYLLGNVRDVHVGDFVEVYATNKFAQEPSSKLFAAQVIYISKPGEKSEHAKSKIKRKSNRRKW